MDGIFQDIMNFSTLVVAILSLFLGGGVTVGGIKFNLPGASAIKRKLYSQRDVHELLSRLETPNVLTVIYQQEKDDLRGKATLSFVSDSALKFYGYRDRHALQGKTAEEIIEILKPYLANAEEVLQDQARVNTELSEGRMAVAKVPMIINDEHPIPEFRGKKFHPMIAHTAHQFGREFTEKYMTVLYVDLSLLPSPAEWEGEAQAARH